jgi:hypothetical protein
MSVAQCAIALASELWTVDKLESNSSTRRALLCGGSNDSTFADCVAEISEDAGSKTKAL